MPALAGNGTMFGTARLPVVPAYITWGDPVTDPPGALGMMQFDVVHSEEHDRTTMITDHPVEEGINVVDHVRPLPDRVTLDVFVSNSPIGSQDAVFGPLVLQLDPPGQDNSFLAGGTSALLGQAAIALGIIKGFPSTITAQVDQFFGDTDYVRAAYDTLTAVRNNALLVQIICPNETYTDMLLENIKMHRDPSTGTSANFTLEFRQVRIISSKIVNAPQPSIPRAIPSTSQGKKDPKAAEGPKEDVATRLLKDAGVDTGVPSS